MRREPIRAVLGDRSFEFTWDGDRLWKDGEPLDLELSALGDGHYVVRLGGKNYTLVAEESGRDTIRLRRSDAARSVRLLDRRAILLEELGMASGTSSRQSQVTAPMPGLVLHVLVEPGSEVKEGDGLVVLEAMKMENELRATHDGTVAKVHVGPGDAVVKNAPLVEFED